MRIKLIHKISLGLIVVVFGLMGTVVVIVDFATTRAVESKLEMDLVAANEVFENFRAVRFQNLLNFNHTVAEVPYLKAVVTTPDLDSEIIQKIVNKVRENTQSDYLTIFNSRREVLANSKSFEGVAASAFSEEVFEDVLAERDYQGILSGSDHLLQLVASPFKMGDRVVGGLVTGHLIDSSTIETLQKMTNTKVVIFGPEKLITTQNERDFFQMLLPAIKSEGNTIVLRKNLKKITVEGHDYLIWISPFRKGSNLNYALIRALEGELIFYDQMRSKLILAAVVTVVLVLTVGFFYSRRITRPIQALVKSVRNLAKGEFDEKVKVVTHDEIGELASSFNDMTENLKRSRNDLVSAKDYMDNIIRSMIESLIVVNADFTIRMVNEATCILLKCTEDDLVGKSFFDVVLDETDFKAEGGFKVLVQKERVHNLEKMYKLKDGTPIPVSFSASVMSSDKEGLNGIVFVAQDIRHRKELELIAMQSEKMAAVGKLAGGISHEIASPISTILGYSELLQRRTKDSNDVKITRPINIIFKEAERCKNIIENLLSFSRIRKPEKHPTDVNELIKSTVVLLRNRLRMKVINLVTELSGEMPKVRLNMTQIQQSILNLCVNAIDALPDRGELRLKTFVGTQEGIPYAYIEVSDNGAGMSEEVQRKLFEPFFTTKEVGKGTGLGLYLVYEIIRNHQGTIKLESELGVGTSFLISLPLASVVSPQKEV